MYYPRQMNLLAYGDPVFLGVGGGGPMNKLLFCFPVMRGGEAYAYIWKNYNVNLLSFNFQEVRHITLYVAPLDLRISLR